MATKKQKHQAAVERREQYLEEIRLENLAILRKEQERRKIDIAKAWEKQHEKHFKFIDDCPHCTELKRKQAVEKIEKIKEAARKTGTLFTEAVGMAIKEKEKASA